MANMKSLVLASACVFLVATATAQERPASISVGADAAATSDVRGGVGSRAGGAGEPLALGWNWYLPLESWSYFNGSTQRLWAEFRNSTDTIETNANNDQAQMINHATSNNHWLGIYWTSSSAWSSSRLWYY
jgi:hypothetical protein